MTEQTFVSREILSKLGEKAIRQIELSEGQTKIVLVDLDRVRKDPRLDKDGKPYYMFICEVMELAANNEEIERDLEVSEFTMGKIVEKLGNENGTLKMTGVKGTGGFLRREFEKI